MMKLFLICHFMYSTVCEMENKCYMSGAKTVSDVIIILTDNSDRYTCIDIFTVTTTWSSNLASKFSLSSYVL